MTIFPYYTVKFLLVPPDLDLLKLQNLPFIPMKCTISYWLCELCDLKT
jgi:hypothetical protein